MEEEESTENVMPSFVIGLGARLITKNPCYIPWEHHPELKLKEHERKFFIDKVTTFLETPGKCADEFLLNRNFHSRDLTREKIRFLCNCIDMAFYGGLLLHRVREILNVEILFDYGPFESNLHVLQPCAKTVFSTHKETEKLVRVVFHFNSNRFGDSARCRETNGIQVRHKVEALLTTMLHEFAHLFLRISCNKTQGHGQKFQLYNSYINGASPGKFSYQDMQTCKTLG
jgi:hypothetical protein